MQHVSDWSKTYWQLLTVCRAIGLRSVAIGRWLVGEWSVTACNRAVTGRWLTVDRFSININSASKKNAFHNRIISLEVNLTVAVAAPAKSKSKCCNCCHDSVQTIDKEKAKAVLVETLDNKKVSFSNLYHF